jgi:hypothetical protein
MDKPTEDAVQELEQIHSSWIEFEVAGEDQSLLVLCTDDIELWPPDSWRFRRSWRKGLGEFRALRFSIVVFEGQNSPLHDYRSAGRWFFGIALRCTVFS